jgi:hypothetical protein
MAFALQPTFALRRLAVVGRGLPAIAFVYLAFTLTRPGNIGVAEEAWKGARIVRNRTGDNPTGRRTSGQARLACIGI